MGISVRNNIFNSKFIGMFCVLMVIVIIFFTSSKFIESINFFNFYNIKNFFSQIYDSVYKSIFNIPIVFIILIIINSFILYTFKFENIKFVYNNLFAHYTINKNLSLKQQYKSFQSFISSSYGALSVASISEIIILLKNYSTPGSIFWMCLTIFIIGAIQLSEILLNCDYMQKSNNSTSFICVLQYAVNKFSIKSKKNKLISLIISVTLIYYILMIMISFFSTTLFQIEQFGNIFYDNNQGSLKVMIGVGLFLIILFGFSAIKRFHYAMKFNFGVIPAFLIFYIFVLISLLLINFDKTILIFFSILEGIKDRDAILPGVVSGLVISFARYIYKSGDIDEDKWEIYEEPNAAKSAIMYSIESFLMMFLIIISGSAFILSDLFPKAASIFGFSISDFITISLLSFAFSVIINEALYSKIALGNILGSVKEEVLFIVVKIFLILGIILGLFKQTDKWVDIADHFSIIFLLINLSASFFIKKEIKQFSQELKKNKI